MHSAKELLFIFCHLDFDAHMRIENHVNLLEIPFFKSGKLSDPGHINCWTLTSFFQQKVDGREANNLTTSRKHLPLRSMQSGAHFTIGLTPN